MKITWLGHGTFHFELPSGQTILLDPWTEGNPKYPKGFEIKRCDSILITHGHFDHIHDAVPLAKKFEPEVCAIFETAAWLEKQGVKNTRPMNKGGSQMLGSVNVTMVHAVHSCGIQDGDQIIYGGEASGYVLRFDDERCIYFSGDTNVFTDMELIEHLYSPELAFLPIGGLFTMGPYEAALALDILQVRKVIPMHYGTFPALTGTPALLAEAMDQNEGGTEIWELQPGETVEW